MPDARVAVVTGAARGIGYAIARKFLDLGYRVALLDIDGATLRRAARRLARDGEVLALRCDVAHPRQVKSAIAKAVKLVEMLLAFAEKNPGMVRVMTGDALVGEHERLQARMNQFFDRFESTLKQSLRVASDGDAPGRAGALVRYSLGCLHQYAKSGFAKKPAESFSAQRRYLLA